MPLPKSKILVLALCAVAAPLIAWLPTYEGALRMASAGNYWLAAASFAAFAFFAWRELRSAGISALRAHLLARRTGILLSAACALFLIAHEPMRPKVLYDEDAICGVARQMHYDRVAAFPVRAHMLEGRLEVLNSTVDKRPVGFPFLLSIVHDLTGYRTENVYALNALLTFALLLLLYNWACKAGGPRAALCSVLLLTGLPLLAQNATAAGFEVMNLCMIAALALTARRYLESEGAKGLDLMIATGLILAITRYESALYLLVLAAVALVKWGRERRITMTWFSALSPLFVLPAFLSNRVFMGNDGFFQAGGEAFISPAYLVENLPRAVYFLFSSPFGWQSNSLLLSCLGLAALLLFAVSLPSLFRMGRADSSTLALLPVLSVALVNTLLGLMENWGQWDDPMAARFSLPFHLALVLTAAKAMALFKAARPPLALPIAAGAWTLLFAAPQMARHRMSDLIPVSLDAAFFRDFAAANAGPRVLFVDESAVGLILDGHAAVSFLSVDMAPWKLEAALQAGIYERIYVCERFRHDEALNAWVPYGEQAAHPALKLRKVAEFRSRSNTLAHISLLEGVDQAPPAEMPHAPGKAAYGLLP